MIDKELIYKLKNKYIGKKIGFTVVFDLLHCGHCII